MQDSLEGAGAGGLAGAGAGGGGIGAGGVVLVVGVLARALTHDCFFRLSPSGVTPRSAASALRAFIDMSIKRLGGVGGTGGMGGMGAVDGVIGGSLVVLGLLGTASPVCSPHTELGR